MKPQARLPSISFEFLLAYTFCPSAPSQPFIVARKGVAGQNTGKEHDL
jgi:hypothetical protein